MVWHIPTILVGEFHGIHGAQVSLVSQFYTFQHHQSGSIASQRSQLAAFSLMDTSSEACGGGVLVGRHASSGVVSDSVQSTFHAIAARALATDDEKDETLIWEDPHVGSIGSLSFHLSDIQCRGEKRKFFIAITHPHHDVLMMRWPVALALLRLVADRWMAASRALVAVEYETCANLLQLREAASRTLRPLLAIVRLCCNDASSILTEQQQQQHQHQHSEADNTTKTNIGGDAQERSELKATLMDFHVLAEVGFLRVFGGLSQRSLVCVSDAVALSNSSEILPPGAAGEKLVQKLQQAVDREYCAIVSATQTVNDPKQRCAVVDAPFHAMPTRKRVVVRPLATWLRIMKSAEMSSFAFPRKAGRLLRALLTGNQVIVASESDEVVAADFALSLAQILPPHLRRVSVKSDAYRPGYVSNILALSDEFTDTYDIVQYSTFSPEKELLVLSEVTSPGAVHVRLHDEEDQEFSFIDVDECGGRDDESGSSFAGNNSSLAQHPTSIGGSPVGGSHAAIKLPSAVSRIIDLVGASVMNQSEDSKHEDFEKWCDEIALLQAQIELVVQEFVARGRLYVPRFHSQYEQQNAALLQRTTTTIAAPGSHGPRQHRHVNPTMNANNGAEKQTLTQRWRKFWNQRGNQNGGAGLTIKHSLHLADCVVAGASASTTSASPAGSLLSFGRSNLAQSAAAAAGPHGGGDRDRDGAASAAGSAYYHNAYHGNRESNLSTATGGAARYHSGGGGAKSDGTLAPLAASSSMATADVTLDLCMARDVDHDVLMYLGGAQR
jgi:hypothetical protein